METRRQRYQARLAQLKARRTGWEQTWRDIGTHMVPYRLLFDTHEQNRGERRDTAIINSTPVQALKTQSAGLMAGVTSPARKWFTLTTVDAELAKNKAVKLYLTECEERIRTALQVGGFYTALVNGTYLDLGSIGTAALFLEEGEPGKVRFEPLPVGQYYLDIDRDGKVDTCYRELKRTARQIVQKFGMENASEAVKNAYNRGQFDSLFDVVHAVQPNDEYKHRALEVRYGGKFSSCWFEPADAQSNRFLRESGYEEFPVLAPRWSTLPGDIYGRGPGWDVLGDCKELQHHETRKAEMIDKITAPPVVIRGANSRKASLLPHAQTHMPRGQDAAVEPIMEVEAAALAAMKDHIAEIEDRIESGMHADLWRRLVDDERNQRATATEVEGLRQEIMLMLGPFLQNADDGLLEPTVTRMFFILERNDLLPLAPEELAGQDLKVQFISIMHKMQQTTELISTRALLQELALLVQTHADAVDKIDGDALVDEIAEAVGVNPAVIRSKDEVAEVRRVRAEAESVKQEGEAALAATQGLQNLSGTDPAKVSEIASMFSPVAAAQGGALGSVKDQ
jgi:hypothetical protein